MPDPSNPLSYLGQGLSNLFGGGGGAPKPVVITDKAAAQKAFIANAAQYAAAGHDEDTRLSAFLTAAAGNDGFLDYLTKNKTLTLNPPAPGGTVTQLDLTNLARAAEDFGKTADAAAEPNKKLADATTELKKAKFTGKSGPFSIDTTPKAPSEFFGFDAGDAAKTTSTAGTLMNFLPLLAMLFMDFPAGLIVAAIGMIGMFMTGAGQGLANMIGMGGAATDAGTPAVAPERVILPGKVADLAAPGAPGPAVDIGVVDKDGAEVDPGKKAQLKVSAYGTRKADGTIEGFRLTDDKRNTYQLFGKDDTYRLNVSDKELADVGGDVNKAILNKLNVDIAAGNVQAIQTGAPISMAPPPAPAAAVKDRVVASAAGDLPLDQNTDFNPGPANRLKGGFRQPDAGIGRGMGEPIV